MFNIDISDTVAGRQIYQEGMLKGARENLMIVLDERFKNVPGDIIDRVKSIGGRELLRDLFRHALRCKDMEDFKQILFKAI